MKIYFIIPVFKTEKYLRRCVDSVLRQTFKDTEIVLVDDGSPDGSPEICDSYGKSCANVTVIHKKNGGLSDARNAALEHIVRVAASGDYLTFLDSDDFVREDYAERTVSICEANKCEAVQCSYEKGDGDSFGKKGEENLVVKSAEEMLLDQRFKSQSWAKTYRVSVFKDVRFPIGVLNEDEFTIYRAVYNCSRAAMISEKLYYYYQRPNSIMNNIANSNKNSAHLYDWLDAFNKRISFFENENKPEQVQRAHEKICAEAILRYCEQIQLKAPYRDEAFTSGEYLRIYRRSFPKMIRRRGISAKRRLMYISFYIFPLSAVLPGKIVGLRK